MRITPWGSNSTAECLICNQVYAGSNPVCSTNGTVVQSAEAMVLKASQCGFESHQCYKKYGTVVQLAEIIVSKTIQCGFESHLCYKPSGDSRQIYVGCRVVKGDGLQNHSRKSSWVRILPCVQ